MEYFQFEYTTAFALRDSLLQLKKRCAALTPALTLVRIFASDPDIQKVPEIGRSIDELLPDALWLGCSSSGGLRDGAFAKNRTVIIATLFFKRVKARLMQVEYPKGQDNPGAGTAARLADAVRQSPWARAAEILVTARGATWDFCKACAALPRDFLVYGGGATNEAHDIDGYVFSKEGGVSKTAAVFLILGGPDLNLEVHRIEGWTPLGRSFEVTASRNNCIMELDSHPAFEAYQRYLGISAGDFFTINSAEFPMACYDSAGNCVFRSVRGCGPHGEIQTFSDNGGFERVRLSYGNAKVIMRAVRQSCESVSRFEPQFIFLVSCGGRRSFWGDDECSAETLPFASLAPAAGFYSGGEYLKMPGQAQLCLCNETILAVAVREGEKNGKARPFVMAQPQNDGPISLEERLVNILAVSTRELERANRALEQMARTDTLSGLLNRGSISAEIEKAAGENRAFTLIMFDLDYFKQVNDSCGHRTGDQVISRFSSFIMEEMLSSGCAFCAGRWGGEEFMIMCGAGADKGRVFAEKILERTRNHAFNASGKEFFVTASAGVTAFKKGESADQALVRVDKALYASKSAGRDRCTPA